MERYETLRVLHPIYSNNAPVFVLAGQLLKDNVEDVCLLQLKFQNVDTKAIKAISIFAKTYDAFGNLLDVGEYSYLDFKDGRDSVFGNDKVIELRNNQTRDIEFKIRQIVLYNDQVLDVSDAKWETLPAQTPLTYKITDPKLMEQYRLENGPKTNFVVKEFGDYWYCTCGAVNPIKELNCHSCRKNKAELEATYNLDALAERLERRLYEEERVKQNQAKARKRVLIWAGSALAAALCVFLLVTQLILPYKQYRQALAHITEGNYETAYTELKELGSFFDSEKYMDNFRFLPTHIEDEYNDIQMDMKYDSAGRLVEEKSAFVLDDGKTVNYKTVYSYKEGKLVSSITETENKVFNASYSEDGKTVECEAYNKADIQEGEVDPEKKENYTYTLTFDEFHNVTSVELTGDYEETHNYAYEYLDKELEISSSENSGDKYYYFYTDGQLDRIRDEYDDNILLTNKLFYTAGIEPYVGWWYRNPWYLFVENRV